MGISPGWHADRDERIPHAPNNNRSHVGDHVRLIQLRDRDAFLDLERT
jgi:hypothetical protein